MNQLNPGVVLAVHSYKGGTGKTLFSTSLAAILASQGKNVCLVDLDLRAPSLDATFAANGKCWMNDYLSGTCEPMDLIKDFSKDRNTPGKFLVALANPSMEAIRDIVTKEKRWEMGALRRLLSLKEFLVNNLALDYMIIDTSPGLSYGSINAVAASDMVLVASTWDASDITGTQGMIGELYELLDKRAVVIVNKIPEQLIMNEELKKRLTDQFKKAFKLPIMDLLPCYCDVLRQERATIMVLDKPDHPFSKILVGVAGEVEEMVEKTVEKTAATSTARA
jgi:MinD-like ATPase involved in chromosome partitioning or flagellar assembly